MDNDTFMEEVKKQFIRCERVLRKKEEFYASGLDRLSQFKKMAVLQEGTSLAALSGVMSKHLTRLVDMMESQTDIFKYKEKDWNETITDTMNYCLLLQGLLAERNND